MTRAARVSIELFGPPFLGSSPFLLMAVFTGSFGTIPLLLLVAYLMAIVPSIIVWWKSAPTAAEALPPSASTTTWEVVGLTAWSPAVQWLRDCAGLSQLACCAPPSPSRP